MAQQLIDSGYSPDLVKALRGGWISWESLQYPIATSPMPTGAAPGQPIQVQPGSQSIPVVPGATVQFQLGTPVPAPASP